MPITKLTKHKRNKDIKYDVKTHTYTYLPENKKFKGITGWISSFEQEEFDAVEVANKIIKNPRGEYYGMTVDEVFAFWKELIEYGDQIHEAIELAVVNGELPEDESMEEHVMNFFAVLDSYGIEPMLSEFVVYNEELGRATPIDIVGVKDGKMVIIDVKTFRKGMEFTSYGDKTFRYPLDDLMESKYEKVCLQTSIPKRWLIDKYGFTEKDFGDSYVMVVNDDTCELILAMDYSNNYVPKMYEYN